VASDVRARPHGAKPERDVEPGELVVISDAGLRSIRAFPPGERLQCCRVRDFARPDSVLWGRNVHTVRRSWAASSRASPAEADIVSRCPTPATSARSATRGIRHAVRVASSATYVAARHRAQAGHPPLRVKVKLNPMREMPRAGGSWCGRLDRARTTSRKIVKMIRSAGPARCTCASVAAHSCLLLRIDTPTRKD